MITLKDLFFRYKGGAVMALKNINLTIKDGEFVGIIGESGAGKSTLTYVLNGVVPHHYDGDFYGAATVDGADTVESTPAAMAKVVGSVFQDIDAQMVASMVEDEMLFALENFGFAHDEIKQRVDEALGLIGISDLRYRSINTLSGGQKQKVAIAAILALKPKVLVLDEPTGELDPASSRQVFSVLKELNRALGITVVVVEQKIMLLGEFADRLIVMSKGSVHYDGSVREVMKHSRELEAIGVHCPRVVSLSNELTARGIYAGEIAVNVGEACRMVRGMLHDRV